MFKMPTKERLQLIMDMVPEMFAVLSQDGEGYNVRISKMGEFMRLKDLCEEVGIKIKLPAEPKSTEYLIDLLKSSNVPDFAFVISSFGRYHIAFAGEDTPVVQLTRDFGIPCVDGKIYIYQKEVSHRDDKRMLASGACSYYHLNKEFCMIYHT